MESPHPIIAEGWGLRPELVAGIGGAGRMVVLVPTEKFRRHQMATLPHRQADSGVRSATPSWGSATGSTGTG